MSRASAIVGGLALLTLACAGGLAAWWWGCDRVLRALVRRSVDCLLTRSRRDLMIAG